MADSKPDGGEYPMSGRLGENLESRPLKTGATFTLIVPAPRLHQLGWDNADYSPGDAAELTLSGKNLGKDPLEMVVEVEQDGAWLEVEKVQGTPDSSQSTVKANWKFPVPPGHAEAVAAREEAQRGNLLTAVWAQTEVSEGATHVAQIEAERMDGQKVVVLIEQELPDGTWRCVAHDEGAVQDGKCAVSWTPPQDAAAVAAANGPPPGSAVSCKFEDGQDLGDADTAWLKVNCTGLENQTVQIVMEREDEDGWSEQSSAVSTVKVGEARAGIAV